MPVTRIENFVTNEVVSAHEENVTDVREMTESDGIVVMENRKFTNMVLPVFSGTEGWYQHIHIVQAIVKSNGWPDETAALQLFVHLKGEALNVALLLTSHGRDWWMDWRHITSLLADWRV